MTYYFDEKTEALIKRVMQMENEDIPHQQFADLVYLLLGGELKYNLFAKLYPDNACYDVFIRLENIGTYAQYQAHPSQFKGTWYGAEGTAIDDVVDEYGAEVIIYHGLNRLTNCLNTVQCGRNSAGDELLSNSVLKRVLNGQRRTCGSIGLYLSYLDHAGIVWIDHENKVINRYDPFYCDLPEGHRVKRSEFEESVHDAWDAQEMIDIGLGEFFGQIMPDYKYLGNNLAGHQCIQEARMMGRKYSDYFCQDYSILYAIRRVNGMSHEQAARDLMEHAGEILDEIEQLMRVMVKVRYGK